MKEILSLEGLEIELSNKNKLHWSLTDEADDIEMEKG